jgi:ubiquinone/menaquinone biosynthesis C-methylase UbiE
MAKSELIARQSAHPTGLLGHVVARVMALDTARVNRRVLRALEPKPGERILELGCGHGRTLRRVARAVGSAGEAVGVDPSDVMVRVARRHNRREIAAGSARVEPGDSTCIPEPDDSFDKLFSVHTLYFWPYLDAGLRELRRVLRPGGLLLLAFHSGENAEVAAKLPDTVYTLRSDVEVADALRRAGFTDVAVTRDADTQLRLARAHA